MNRIHNQRPLHREIKCFSCVHTTDYERCLNEWHILEVNASECSHDHGKPVNTLANIIYIPKQKERVSNPPSFHNKLNAESREIFLRLAKYNFEYCLECVDKVEDIKEPA